MPLSGAILLSGTAFYVALIANAAIMQYGQTTNQSTT